MTGARRGRPEDKSISGRDLWTEEGTNALIRKLQNDPGLTEEFRKQAIESVRSGAFERGVGPKPVESIKPKTEVKVTKPETAKQTPTTKPVELTPTKDAWEQFDTYQKFTDSVAIYPPEVGLPYAIAGLCGETGEVAGKMSEIISKNLMNADGLAVDERRDNLFQLNTILKEMARLGAEAEKLKKALRKGEKKLLPLRTLTEDEKSGLAAELGDVEWYGARLAKELGLTLSDIAKKNVEKLTSRKARGVIQGSGDNR